MNLQNPSLQQTRPYHPIMNPKLKPIFATALGTTAFWAIVVAGLGYFGRLSHRPLAVGSFYFSPPANGGILITRFWGCWRSRFGRVDGCQRQVLGRTSVEQRRAVRSNRALLPHLGSAGIDPVDDTPNRCGNQLTTTGAHRELERLAALRL